MIVNNHYNEEVEIDTIKRVKTLDGYNIKVHTSTGASEYWDYNDFMEYNSDWEWNDGE